MNSDKSIPQNQAPKSKAKLRLITAEPGLTENPVERIARSRRRSALKLVQTKRPKPRVKKPRRAGSRRRTGD